MDFCLGILLLKLGKRNLRLIAGYIIVFHYLLKQISQNAKTMCEELDSHF